MKAENMFIGQRVQVKCNEANTRGFYTSSLGNYGTIERIELGFSLDVLVKLDDGRNDWGHHTGIRKVKEV